MAFRHDIKPCGFNPEYRPGFGEKVSAVYKKLCENNPGLTRKLRKSAHRIIENSVMKDFPTAIQLGVYNPGHWKNIKKEKSLWT